MKFNTILYTLVAASATLANVVQRNDASCVKKINEYLHNNRELENQCISINSKETMLSDINDYKSKYEEGCANLKSEKCQKYFEDINNLSSGCDDEGTKGLIKFISQIKEALDSACATDENNKICPIGNFAIEDSFNERELVDKFKNVDYDTTEKLDAEYRAKKEEAFDKAVNDSCKSKACANASVPYLLISGEEINYDALTRYKDTIFDKPFSSKEAIGKPEFYAAAFLKSDYCIKQQQNTQGATAGNQLQNIQNTNAGNQTQNGPANGNQQNVQTNDASTIKYSMMFTIVALSFMLF